MLPDQLPGQLFDRRANSYDAHAIVQKQMAKQLVDWAPSCSSYLLDIGCGTGSVLSEYLKRPDTQIPIVITAIDKAPNMIALAKQQITTPSVEWLCDDIEQCLPQLPNYDLILSNACFQWLESPGPVIGALLEHLTPGGTLLFSTFLTGTFTELVTSYRLAEEALGLPHLQHTLTFQSAEAYLNTIDGSSDYQLVVEQQSVTLYYPDVLSFLKAIQLIGANGGRPIHKHSNPRQVLNGMIKHYNHQKTDLGIPVTYEILFVKVIKPSC
jgi:malonyl-CoA O-methyltransferase